MGDTYFIDKIKCAYCDKVNNFEADEWGFGLPYTFESGHEFICEFCKKKNKVVMDFATIRMKSKKRNDRK